MLYVCHPVICLFDKISNFQIRILFFLLSAEKESLFGQCFFVGPIRDLFSKFKKSKYQNFMKKATHWMTYKEQKKIKFLNNVSSC